MLKKEEQKLQSVLLGGGHKRKSKKQEPGQSTPAFRSAQALGKAVLRAKRKKAVCQRLFANMTTGTSDVPKPTPKARATGFSAAKIALVKAFYQRDDISRQAPGRKDIVTVRNKDGSKVEVQSRHLTSSVLEVFALFKEENLNLKIGMSKFADLRPCNVLLSNKLPHNVCLWKYHENFILAVNALHERCPELPSYSYEPPDKLLCYPTIRQCWLNECDKCKGFKAMTEMDSDDAVTWFI